MTKLAALLLLQCTLCVTVRVPVTWNDDSEINNNDSSDLNKQEDTAKIIPKEYFEYTAAKPQFAIDIATFHGVKSPQKHYSAYPVAPYTGVRKPSLGYHHLLNPDKNSYHPYQGYVNKSSNYVKPASTFFDVYHPYKSEEPALQKLYKDPVLNKIKNDIRDSKNRLQNYETNAGESDIKQDEYLDSPKQIDHKHTAHKNIPAEFEIHLPLRQSNYYQPLPKNRNREHILNQKFKHPWNQNYVKVTPMHYKPVKTHLQRLRQQHALRYNDEQNEYPQLLPADTPHERPDGYDIYENAKSKYVNLRNNVDESVNKAALESQASGNYKLELQDDDKSEAISVDHEEDEFVPIKNYAQVRKTETTKHLPRERAFQDAESYEDLINAPRLREAVKSTKAQIVYSEEGYEDSAYDHAGEQKHASDHEGHGGFLKEDESSRGKYKIPSVSTSHNDADRSEYRDKVLHGKKWNNDSRQLSDERDVEDYSEDEYENTDDSDVYAEGSNTNEVKTGSEKILKEELDDESKNKIQDVSKDKLTNSTMQHELNKREVHSVVPEIDITSTFLTEGQIDNISRTSHKENKTKDNELLKYPYYYAKNGDINKDSPLRYAENLKLIPKKTQGGTEFYNSRSKIECSEVEDDVDPIPEKLKTGESPDNDKESEINNLKNKQRLKGLGNKIDCFKAKYFGENPLDSPFFKEDVISNPYPPTIPNLKAFGTESILKPISKLKQLNRRKKRATTFVYEPYKIIRESQVPDSRKTTTSSNISPLIKQLQSSRIIDKTNSKHNSDQDFRQNTNSKIYKDIDKDKRQKNSKNENKEMSDTSFADVNVDQRRGEPRYELQHQNHKTRYTPVENKTALSFQDYKEKMDSKIPNRHQNGDTDKHTSKDEDEFEDDDDEEDDDEEYEEYDSDEDDENMGLKSISTTTTTTTTRKPISRKSITTEKPTLKLQKSTATDDNDYTDNKPKLQLVTRFRSHPVSHTDEKSSNTSPNKNVEHIANIDENPSKYREKKKKLTKSTLVTDTRTYGEGNDDMPKEDIDEMIGVKQSDIDYMPSYEKNKQQNIKSDTDEKFDSEDYYNIKNNSEDEEDDDDEEDDSEEEDDSNESEETTQEDNNDESFETDATTPEPTKRALLSTTEKTVTTTEILKINIDSTPKISRKRIEIHKELPINKSSPNITQYKQDIKEIEFIKEIPSRSRKQNQKDAEVLDLYKDINLAKDVNKLGGVEIFKENLDLKSGPRHGGNYRMLEIKQNNYDSTPKPKVQVLNQDDVETSQSVTNKYLEVDIIPSSRRRKIDRSLSNLRSSRNDKVKNAKLIELSEVPDKPINGGNLKVPQSRRRVRNKSAKYIELDDEDKEESNSMHGGNFKSYGTKRNDMHGGNYRSERLRQAEDKQDLSKDTNDKNTLTNLTSNNNKNNAAVLLNGYVRAMPILTTTPNYIVDPSKRKYYYVDA